LPLTEAQKVNIRRHLGFPVAGLPLISPAGGTLGSGNAGYRFLQAYGQLEFRLNNLAGPEEASLTGEPTGIFALIGPAVTPGVTFQVIFSGGGLVSPVTISYTSVSGDTQSAVVANLASRVNNNATLQAAGFIALNPFGQGPMSQNQGQPQTILGNQQTGNPAIPIAQVEILLIAPGVTSFTMTCSSSGTPSLVTLMQGQQVPPTSTVSLVTNPSTVLWGYLPICDWLEGAVAGSTQNLDTSRADVWYPRMDEVEERNKLYDYWRRRMYLFMFDDGSSSLGPRSGGIGGGYSGRVI
jgi:hypothetical protein